MTKTSIIARPLLILIAALIAAPLAAQPPTIVTGERQPVYQERVSFADLDLRERSARESLKLRVRSAASRVCIQAHGPLEEYALGSSTCAELTYEAARPQIAAAIGRAKAGQQMAMAMLLRAPARMR